MAHSVVILAGHCVCGPYQYVWSVIICSLFVILISGVTLVD